MAARRGVGLAAFADRTGTSQAYAQHGSALKASNTASLLAQKEVIQQMLHNFAVEHAEAIKQRPSFRAEFARMCHAVGVDPLAGSNIKAKQSSGLRAKVFGADLNGFYFAVGVRIVELCQRTRAENGGLIGVRECCESVSKGNAIGGGLQVSEDDVVNAVKALKPLGRGFDIVEFASKKFIRSVPKELNIDQSTVLEILQLLGSITVTLLMDNLRWEKARAETVIEDLMADSLVWVDLQCREPEYWSPQNLLDED